MVSTGLIPNAKAKPPPRFQVLVSVLSHPTGIDTWGDILMCLALFLARRCARAAAWLAAGPPSKSQLPPSSSPASARNAEQQLVPRLGPNTRRGQIQANRHPRKETAAAWQRPTTEATKAVQRTSRHRAESHYIFFACFACAVAYISFRHVLFCLCFELPYNPGSYGHPEL
jgi:hypothetical protein